MLGDPVLPGEVRDPLAEDPAAVNEGVVEVAEKERHRRCRPGSDYSEPNPTRRLSGSPTSTYASLSEGTST